MRKLKLDIDFSSDISLIAISCHKPNFWLAMQLNKILKTDLRRMDDLPYYHPIAKELLPYVLFYFANDSEGFSYFLLGNYNPDGKLFPEYRAADFFLMLSGTSLDEQIDQHLPKIKSIKGVLTSFAVEKEKIKDLKNFISDLELHMIDQIKKGKH